MKLRLVGEGPYRNGVDGEGDVDRPVIGEVDCGLERRDMDGNEAVWRKAGEPRLLCSSSCSPSLATNLP